MVFLTVGLFRSFWPLEAQLPFIQVIGKSQAWIQEQDIHNRSLISVRADISGVNTDVLHDDKLKGPEKFDPSAKFLTNALYSPAIIVCTVPVCACLHWCFIAARHVSLSKYVRMAPEQQDICSTVQSGMRFAISRCLKRYDSFFYCLTCALLVTNFHSPES